MKCNINYYTKISKSSFLKAFSRPTTKRLRPTQVLLFAIFYSYNGKRPIGRVRDRGKNRGKLCYNKALIKGLKNWTKLSRPQIYRHLNNLKAHKYIVEDDSLCLEYRVKCPLIPGYREDYFIVPLNNVGIKGFDVWDFMLKCYEAQSHPDTPKVKNNIPRQTKYYRFLRHKQALIFHNVQKVQHTLTVYINVNSTKVKNTDSDLKNFYKNHLIVTTKRGPPMKVDWKQTKILSDHQKVCCDIDTHKRAVFFKGRVYVSEDDPDEPSSYIYYNQPKKEVKNGKLQI